MASIYITTIIYDDISIDYQLPDTPISGKWDGSIKFEFQGSGDLSKYIKKDGSIDKALFANDLLNGDIKIFN